MTPQEAAVNIRIAVRSADAFSAIGRITVALEAMATASVAAETALVGLTGVASALAAALAKAAADGALLASALSKMKGMTLARLLSGITGAATSAATAMAKAAVAADALFISLTRVAGAATAAAAGLGAFTAAAKGAGAAAAGAAASAGGSGAARGFTASGAAAGAAAGQMRALGAGAGLAKREYDDFGQRVRATSTRLDDADAGMRNINNGMRQLTDGTDRARAASQRYDSTMRQTNNSLGEHDRAVRNSYAGWDRFNNNLATGSHRLRMAGSQAQWTGRQLSMFFTAPLAIMGAIGVKSALDIEKAMVHLSKVYDGPSEDIQKFTGYFKALSETMGVQQSEITEIGATWAQVGAQGTELAKMTKLTSEAMILGDMSAAEATQALIAVQAQYKLSAEGQYDANGKLIEGTAGVKETLAQLNIVENATGASMQDLTQAFQRSAASARIAGVDQAHLAAMIATLVPATGSAAKAGVALNSIFAQLGSPASKAAGALKDLGFNIDDAAWRSSSLTERLENIADQFVKLDNQSKMDLARPLAGIFQMPKAVQLLGDIAARNGDGLSYYKQALEGALDPIKSMAVYQKELNTVLESNPQKLKQAGVIIQNALVDAVIPIIPHIVYLAQSLAKLFKSFQDLSPVTQKWVMIVLLALAAVGPLAMLVGSIAILFGVFGKSLVLVSRIAKFAAFNILGLGTATRVVQGEMVTRTPLIVKIWRWMTGAMSKISAAFMIGLRAIYALGMGVLNGILAVGGALGLKTFSRYQALQTLVQRRASAARLGIIRTEQATATGLVAAGGRAQAGAAAAGAAGAGRAGRRGFGGMLLGVVSILAMFPATIWKYMKIAGSAIASAVKNFGRIFTGGATGWAKALENGLARLLTPIARWAGTAWRALASGLARFGPAILEGLVRAVPWIARAAGVLAGVFTGPIGWAILAVITLISLFPKQTWNIMKKVGSLLAQPFLNLYAIVSREFKAIIGLVARVWNGVANIIKKVAGDGDIPLLAKPFVIGVQIAGKALGALPRVVSAVFRGVVGVIQKAAQAVYKAFSYLNPFAHHSPSLVENVTAGMSIVTSEFADASRSIQGSLRSAYGAMSRFGNASASVTVPNVQRKRGEERAKIAKADPSLLASYDALRHEMALLETQLVDVTDAMQNQQLVVDGLEREIASADRVIKGMQKSLDGLQKAADAAGKALGEAQANLDKYVNAPIEGTQAMSDAIFANEMAQKKLRLEIMKMEDAGGAVDDVADKFAKLQGEIETLSGQRSELRGAGAGSDILGEYDKMISDLQDQQGAIATTGNSAIEKATKELEELQRRGEMLDLENSLKFDPLNRQAEQLANTVKEMPFEEKIAGIRKYQAQVDTLTVAQENATKAVEAQQAVIDNATAARDLLADRLDSEQEKLDALTETHDQLTTAIDNGQASIDETISAIEEMEAAAEAAQQAADDLAGKMDDVTSSTDAAADALDGFGLAADNLDDYELPGGSFDSDAALGDIDELTKGLTDDIAKQFADIDLFGGIKEKFASFKDWIKGIPGAIGRTVAGWASSAGSWFAGVGEGIGNFFSTLPTKIGTTVSGWASSVGTWFSGVGSSIGSWFGNLWGNTIWPALQSLPGQIANFFMNLPTYLIQAFAYIAGFMAGLVVKAFAIGAMIMNYFVGGGFAEDVSGLWNDHIYPWISGVFGSVMDFIFITIPGFGQKIWDYFAGGGFTSDVGAIWNDHVFPWLSGIFNSVMDFIFITIPGFGQKIWDYFAGGGFTSDVAAIWNDHVFPWLSGIFNSLKTFVTESIPEFGRSVWNYFANGGFEEDVSGVWNKMWEWGGNVIEGLKQGISDKWQDIKDWVRTNIVEPFTNGFKDALGINSPSTVFAEYGGWIIEGLWEGMKSWAGRLKENAVNLVKENVINPVKDAFTIGSPSKLFHQYGEWVGEGLGNGIAASSGGVAGAAQTLADSVSGVDLGTIAAPAMDAAAPVAASASAPTANPAAGMDVALAETTAATQLVWDAFDVYMDTALAAMELQFATTFTNINVNTVASVQMTSDQVIALTNTLHTQTTSMTNTWATNLTNIMNLLRDNTIATVNAMVNANITSFTMQRDQLTALSNSTRDNVSAAFGQLGTNLTNTMASVIRPMFESFGPLLGQVTQWFADTVQNVGTQWSGIKEPVAAPARFIVNDVYNNGIKEAWNKVNGFLGLQPLEGFVAGFAGGGAPGVAVNSLSNPNNPIDISGGGALKAASSQRDSTLFAGMRGEYVLNKDQVKQWGGIGQLEAWRSNTLKGTKPMEGGGQFRVPGFEDGGRPGVIDEVFTKLAKYKGRGYDYGGGGDPGGYDCSGWTGAVHKVLLGQRPEGRIWTTEVDFGSFGYKRGKDGYWSMGVHNGGGGMNSHTAGTLDGINFESGGAHNTSTWGGPAAGTVHPQFENQYYLPNLGGVFKGSAGGSGSAPSAMDMMTQAYREVMDPIKARIPTGQAGTVGQMPKAGYDKFDTEVYGFLSKKAQEMDAANASMGNVSYDIAAGVEQWRGVVKEVLGAQGRPLRYDTLTLQQMQTESGGNPNAINGWDSNAAAGTPSKGLMQVIDPTFASYRDARYPNNIWDPHANIAAALNWVYGRYGGPEGVWGQGHGYDQGGMLQPGITTAINASRKPEPILTAAQWSGVLNLAGSVTSFIGKIAGTIKGALQWGFKWFIGQPIIKNPPVPPVVTPPKPPVTPPVVIPPAAVKGFWEDASQQMKTWTPDLVKAMEGVEGVVRNAPRIIGETVVSEWPTLPAPTIPSIKLPEINLPPELVQPPVLPPVVTTPTTPTTPGTGTGTGGSGTGTGTGVGSASGLGSLLADLWNRFVGGSNKVINDVRPSVEKAIGTLVPVMQQAASIMFSDPVGAMKLAAGAIQSQVQALAPIVGSAVQNADKQYGLTPAEQTSLLGTAISAGKKIAADNGIQLPAQLVSFLDSIATAQTTALRNTSTSTAKSASTSANTAAGQTQTVTASTVNITININGDLSMPNVKTKDDAAAFLSNLRNLVAT